MKPSDPPPGGRGGVELGLQLRALELAPRAVPRGPGMRAAAGGQRARVAYRREALARELRAALVAEPLAHPEPGLSEHEEVCELPTSLLEELARHHPDAELLALAWRHAGARPPRPRIMGVLNVTPDSFSDGGRFQDPSRAVERGLELLAEGADLIDVGGESTRPGSRAVPEGLELARVLPVIERLARETGAPISIDTTKAGVARRACGAGASWINDTSAGRDDPELLGVAAEVGATLVLMHRLGRPADMQQAPAYDDPVREVTDFLRERAAACLHAGIGVPKILVDPGIGFGKRLEHNLELLRRLVELRSLGLPLLLGVSRKTFIAEAERALGSRQPLDPARSLGSGGDEARPDPARPADRIGGTAAAVTAGVLAGASVLRVHDVAVMAQAIRVAEAIAHGTTSPPAREVSP